jgi:hypothetical protein
LQPDIVPIYTPPVSTQGELVAKFAAGVVDTGGNLTPASLTPVANLPTESLTPVVQLYLRSVIF